MKEFAEIITKFFNSNSLLKDYKKFLKQMLKNFNKLSKEEINELYGEKATNENDLKFAIDYINLILKYRKTGNENEK